MIGTPSETSAAGVIVCVCVEAVYSHTQDSIIISSQGRGKGGDDCELQFGQEEGIVSKDTSLFSSIVQLDNRTSPTPSKSFVSPIIFFFVL
jgi:hypothetical protein